MIEYATPLKARLLWFPGKFCRGRFKCIPTDKSTACIASALCRIESVCRFMYYSDKPHSLRKMYMRNATTEVKRLRVTYVKSNEYSFQLIDNKFQLSGNSNCPHIRRQSPNTWLCSFRRCFEH